MIRTVLLLTLAVVTVGCTSNDDDAGRTPSSYGQVARTPSISGFQVAPFDELEVRVFGVSDFDGTYQVDDGGYLKLPLIAPVPAAGRSTFELADALEERLGERYLQDPNVTVRVAQAFGREITVEGAVGNPGVFPISGRSSLLQAVALAGGTSDTAKLDAVTVFRLVDGERAAVTFDLRAIREGRREDPPLYGGDVVFVDGSALTATYRELLRSIPFLALFLR